MTNNQKTGKSSGALYKTIWRWHFYAGLIIAPFLVILAITGGIYLFQPQIDQQLYQEYYEVTPTGERTSADQQIATVKGLYPGATVTSYRPGETDERSSEVGISLQGESYTVFMNPYTGEEIGKLNNNDRLTEKVEKIHGELMIGTIGDRIVELVTCWAIVLIVTGLYLWFPRKNKGMAGVLLPRFNKGPKILRRDLHAVPAFWVTGGMLFLILTGLPWSGFWGTGFQNIVTNSGMGYPPSVWTGSAPESITKTKEIADVPWAAENLHVPQSTVQDYKALSIDHLVQIAKREGVDPSYTIYIPQTKEGVYTFSAFPAKAQDEITMHIDQYSGAVLADYRYDHYHFMGKIIAWGITLHKGTQFGLINQLIGLLVCLGIVLTAVSGFYLWLKRKPSKKLGAPLAPSALKMKGFLCILILLGVIFPLVGLSLIIVWLLDWLIIQRIPAMKQFFNA
nr:PepSY domain-containing protein [Lysinibacillus timonensis]